MKGPKGLALRAGEKFWTRGSFRGGSPRRIPRHIVTAAHTSGERGSQPYLGRLHSSPRHPSRVTAICSGEKNGGDPLLEGSSSSATPSAFKTAFGRPETELGFGGFRVCWITVWGLGDYKWQARNIGVLPVSCPHVLGSILGTESGFAGDVNAPWRHV